MSLSICIVLSVYFCYDVSIIKQTIQEAHDMITYRIKEEKLYWSDIGDYIAFGIDAFHMTDKMERLIETVPDVFLKREEAEDFVRLCNSSELDIIHLHEIIEDTIGIN